MWRIESSLVRPFVVCGELSLVWLGHCCLWRTESNLIRPFVVCGELSLVWLGRLLSVEN